jgi:hypothetical protein
MTTFKKLGLKMHRNSMMGWSITGQVSYSSGTQENKGTAMSNALARWAEEGSVVFDKVRGWHYNDGR